MTTDDRGRSGWSSRTRYPNWIKDGKEGTDRILILEDKKGERPLRLQRFLGQGHEPVRHRMGFGGVWLCSTPNLLFIPVKPGEDKPAGPPEVVLDGWSLQSEAQRLQRPDLGTGRLALRLQRHPGHVEGRPAGHAGRRARAAQLRRLALSSDARRNSKPSPGAPPIPGAWISTTTARCSSPIA